MKELLNKKFDWTIAATILLGLGFLGMIFYVEHRYDAAQKEYEGKQSKTNETLLALDGKIKSLGEALESTLTEEQKKNEELRDALDDVTDSIETLGRVATTDRDLLKKYSKTYFLNENYAPLDLKIIPAEWRSATSSNYQILADVAPYLEDLFEAAEDDGLDLLAQSAYRSFGTQSQLKAAYTVTYGAGANRFSADQGYSEHQLGTTLDFTTKNLSGNLEGFENTPEYKWLLENAYKYGFIISYPSGNAYYKFEPWHWRFVGQDLAKKLHSDGVFFYDVEQRVIDSYLTRIFD